MNLELLDHTQRDRWDQFVRSHPHGTFFNTGGWLETLRQSCGFPYYLITAGSNGAITAGASMVETNSVLFGRKLTVNPFSLYSELLYNGADDCHQVLEYLMNLGREKKCRCIELRTYNRLPAAVMAGLAEMQNRVIPVLTLGNNYEQTHRRYAKQFRSNLTTAAGKISRAGGFEFAAAGGGDDYRGFYQLVLELFKNKHGMVPAPYRFFESLQSVMEPNHYRLYVIKHRGGVVAGAMIYYFRDRAYYAWSASAEAYSHYSLTACLLDQVIRDLHEQGIKQFDMGVTAPDNQHLLFFKTRFGAEITRPYFYFIPLADVKYRDRSAETGVGVRRTLTRFMPMPLFEWITDLTYRHLT